MAGKKYRYVGNHAETLDDGRPVAPGDYVHLTDEEMKSPQNSSLAAEGVLIGMSDAGEEQIDKAETRVKREEAKTTKEGEA